MREIDLDMPESHTVCDGRWHEHVNGEVEFLNIKG